MENNSIARYVNIFPPHPFFKGKALETRLRVLVTGTPPLPNQRDLPCRAAYTSGIQTKLNARLPNIRQRAYLFEAHISANKISLPQGYGYTEIGKKIL